MFPLVLVLLASIANADGSAPFPMRVRLLSKAMIDVLERENQISQLCPSLDAGEAAACRKRTLAPKIYEAGLHEKPDASSPQSGKLVFTITPGKSPEARFVPSAGASKHFAYDDAGGDWGYSSSFWHTALERKGSWALLPKGPFPKALWIDLKKGLEMTEDLEIDDSFQPAVEAESIYSVSGALEAINVQTGAKEDFAGESVFVLKADSAGIVFRSEVESDMDCGEGHEKPPVMPPSFRISPAQTLGADGHLKFQVKYGRGC